MMRLALIHGNQGSYLPCKVLSKIAWHSPMCLPPGQKSQLRHMTENQIQVLKFCRIWKMLKVTVFGNYSKCCILFFFKAPNWTFFSIFLLTQNVNVARFARNVEFDFLGDFQTLCTVCRSREIKALALPSIQYTWELSSKRGEKK